jgi:hypothetical protein
MSFFLTGNIPINSTQEPQVDPSTTVIMAELESSRFRNSTVAMARIYNVFAWVGGSSNALWVCEQATSTAISSGVVVDKVFWRSSPQQTAQYVHKFRLMSPTDRIRIRMVSSNAGTYEAKLQAEEVA